MAEDQHDQDYGIAAGVGHAEVPDPAEHDVGPEVETVIEAVANGHTYEAAGRMVNRSSRTVRRWLARPDAQSLLRERRTERAAELGGRLTAAAGAAVDALTQGLESEQEGLRVRSADAILRHNHRALDREAAQQRLTLTEADDDREELVRSFFIFWSELRKYLGDRAAVSEFGQRLVAHPEIAKLFAREAGLLEEDGSDRPTRD